METLLVFEIPYVAGRGFHAAAWPCVDAMTGVAARRDPATDKASDLRDSMVTPSPPVAWILLNVARALTTR